MGANREFGETVPLLWATALRLILCVAISAMAWKYLGLIGLVVTAPIYGIALARPIISLIASVVQMLRARAMHDLEGRHFVHRGHTLLIDTDDAGQCWLDVQDVREAGVHLPADARLSARFAPDDLQVGAKGEGTKVRADALLRALQGSSSADSRSFSLWLERMVIAPAQKAHLRRFGRRG